MGQILFTIFGKMGKIAMAKSALFPCDFTVEAVNRRVV